MVDRFIESIQAEGLVKGTRQHAHLSAATTTAEKVGGRRGKPRVFRVRSGEMQADGFEFFLSDNAYG